jgi:hypothetical protein
MRKKQTCNAELEYSLDVQPNIPLKSESVPLIPLD